ncbi:MAG: hypothetical protein ABIG39_04920 [Candidatus Micrarchaeota archaeon]
MQRRFLMPLVLLLVLSAPAVAQICSVERVPTELDLYVDRNIASGVLTATATLTGIDLVGKASAPLILETIIFQECIVGNYTNTTCPIYTHVCGAPPQDYWYCSTGCCGSHLSKRTDTDGKAIALFPLNNESTIIAMYPGDDVYLPSNSTASYLYPPLFAGLSITPCFPLFLILGMLMLSMNAMGKSPIRAFDFSAIRTPRARRRGPTALVMGTGFVAAAVNVGKGIANAKKLKRLDKEGKLVKDKDGNILDISDEMKANGFAYKGGRVIKVDAYGNEKTDALGHVSNFFSAKWASGMGGKVLGKGGKAIAKGVGKGALKVANAQMRVTSGVVTGALDATAGKVIGKDLKTSVGLTEGGRTNLVKLAGSGSAALRSKWSGRTTDVNEPKKKGLFGKIWGGVKGAVEIASGRRAIVIGSKNVLEFKKTDDMAFYAYDPKRKLASGKNYDAFTVITGLIDRGEVQLRGTNGESNIHTALVARKTKLENMEKGGLVKFENGAWSLTKAGRNSSEARILVNGKKVSDVDGKVVRARGFSGVGVNMLRTMDNLDGQEVNRDASGNSFDLVGAQGARKQYGMSIEKYGRIVERNGTFDIIRPSAPGVSTVALMGIMGMVGPGGALFQSTYAMKFGRIEDIGGSRFSQGINRSEGDSESEYETKDMKEESRRIQKLLRDDSGNVDPAKLANAVNNPAVWTGPMINTLLRTAPGSTVGLSQDKLTSLGLDMNLQGYRNTGLAVGEQQLRAMETAHETCMKQSLTGEAYVSTFTSMLRNGVDVGGTNVALDSGTVSKIGIALNHKTRTDAVGTLSGLKTLGGMKPGEPGWRSGTLGATNIETKSETLDTERSGIAKAYSNLTETGQGTHDVRFRTQRLVSELRTENKVHENIEYAKEIDAGQDKLSAIRGQLNYFNNQARDIDRAGGIMDTRDVGSAEFDKANETFVRGIGVMTDPKHKENLDKLNTDANKIINNNNILWEKYRLNQQKDINRISSGVRDVQTSADVAGYNAYNQLNSTQEGHELSMAMDEVLEDVIEQKQSQLMQDRDAVLYGTSAPVRDYVIKDKLEKSRKKREGRYA